VPLKKCPNTKTAKSEECANILFCSELCLFVWHMVGTSPCFHAAFT